MQESKKPLVSVITPGWNGKEFVFRLLDSLLEQTYTEFEYIYVDDESTDGTLKIVESYRKKFESRGIDVQIICKKNGGVSEALNEGFKYVRGEYICWPEYDDVLTPDSIEKKVAFLESHPEYGCVTSDATIVNIEDIDTPIGYLSHKRKNRFDENQFEHFLRRDSIATAACHMIRTSAFEKTHCNRHIYPSRKGPNWQILLPIYYEYKRGFIDESLCKYVIRKDSISNSIFNAEDKHNALEQDLDILINTVNLIEMSKEEKQKYMNIIMEEHYYWHFRIAFASADKKGCREYYRKYKSYQKPNSKLKVAYMLVCTPFSKNIIDLLILIKHKCSK